MNLLTISSLPESVRINQPIVLFDGDCNLCNRSLRFLIRHNTHANLKFASLNSDAGMAIMNKAKLSSVQADTLLFLDGNILYSYSTAVLKIAAHLNYPWRLCGAFILIPARLRDMIYRYVAKNRYKWFGRSSYCHRGDETMHGRFLA